MVKRRVVASHGPFGNCELDAASADGWQEPVLQLLQQQYGHPLMPQSLRMNADASRPSDHALEVIVRLAEVVDGSRQEDDSPKAFPVDFHRQPKSLQLVISRCIKNLNSSGMDIRQVNRESH
jgi:hypothetical protein